MKTISNFFYNLRLGVLKAKRLKIEELTTHQEKQYATLENPNYCLIMELSHQYSLSLY